MNEDIRALERLLYVLEWCLDVQLRYPTDALDFSLVYISCGDKATLGNRYGAKVALQMLVELGHDLRRAMRKSDIVARDSADFWVLIPQVGAELIVPKVSKIVEIASANGLDVVDREISTFKVEDNHILKENNLSSPMQFLDYVRHNRTISKNWSVKSD